MGNGQAKVGVGVVRLAANGFIQTGDRLVITSEGLERESLPIVGSGEIGRYGKGPARVFDGFRIALLKTQEICNIVERLS